MKPEKSVRAKRNLRYRKNRQKRIAEAKNSAKETTQEIGSNQSLRPNQQEQEIPQQSGIAVDEPHFERNGPQAVESGGSVLADKHMETLEGLMKAYEARLKANKTIEQRWRRYPDPVNEERQLEMYRRLIEATQALLEKVSHPKTGENNNTSQEPNKTEPKKEDRQVEQSGNTQPLMCQN